MNSEHARRLALVNRVRDEFNLSEIQVLCLNLGVNYENISGTTPQRKSMELVLYLERRGRLDELEKEIGVLRGTASQVAPSPQTAVSSIAQAVDEGARYKVKKKTYARVNQLNDLLSQISVGHRDVNLVKFTNAVFRLVVQGVIDNPPRYLTEKGRQIDLAYARDSVRASAFGHPVLDGRDKNRQAKQDYAFVMERADRLKKAWFGLDRGGFVVAYGLLSLDKVAAENSRYTGDQLLVLPVVYHSSLKVVADFLGEFQAFLSSDDFVELVDVAGVSPLAADGTVVTSDYFAAHILPVFSGLEKEIRKVTAKIEGDITFDDSPLSSLF